MKEYLKKSQRFVALVLSVLISFTMMPNVFALNTGVAGDRDPDRETVKAGYTLKGVVKDSAGKVVSGASVKLTGGTKAKTVKTTTKGAYTFTGVAKGTSYVLTATKAGFEETKTSKFSVTKATTKNITLKAIGYDVTVIVKNEDGKAVKNAEVTLKSTATTLTGKTNAYGKVVLAKATKGYYTGTVKATGYEDAKIDRFNVTKAVTKNVELTKKATEVTVTGLAITAAPTKVTYTAGEKLDLTGLSVTLTMSDDKTEVVPFASFATKGIETTPANGADLAVTDTKVTVTHKASTKSADQAITVTAAPVVTAASELAKIAVTAVSVTGELTYATAKVAAETAAQAMIDATYTVTFTGELVGTTLTGKFNVTKATDTATDAANRTITVTAPTVDLAVTGLSIVKVSDNNLLELTFNEEVDATTAGDINNYTMTGNARLSWYGYVIEGVAKQAAPNGNKVRLTLTKDTVKDASLLAGGSVVITVSNVKSKNNAPLSATANVGTFVKAPSKVASLAAANGLIVTLGTSASQTISSGITYAPASYNYSVNSSAIGTNTHAKIVAKIDDATISTSAAPAIANASLTYAIGDGSFVALPANGTITVPFSDNGLTKVIVKVTAQDATTSNEYVITFIKGTPALVSLVSSSKGVASLGTAGDKKITVPTGKKYTVIENNGTTVTKKYVLADGTLSTTTPSAVLTGTEIKNLDNTFTYHVRESATGKEFTSFTLDSVAGTINETAKQIRITVSQATDITDLAATFAVSDMAVVKIGSTEQESGTSKNNFTNNLTYTVTADDGSISTYTVIVSKGAPTISSTSVITVGATGTSIVVSGAGFKAANYVASDFELIAGSTGLAFTSASYDSTKKELTVLLNGEVKAGTLTFVARASAFTLASGDSNMLAFTVVETKPDTLPAGVYKKVASIAAAGDVAIDATDVTGNTLLLKTASGTQKFDITNNPTIKSIMNSGIASGNSTFTITAGKISAISHGTNEAKSIVLAANDCATVLKVTTVALNPNVLTLTGSAGSVEIIGGQVNVSGLAAVFNIIGSTGVSDTVAVVGDNKVINIIGENLNGSSDTVYVGSSAIEKKVAEVNVNTNVANLIIIKVASRVSVATEKTIKNFFVGNSGYRAVIEGLYMGSGASIINTEVDAASGGLATSVKLAGGTLKLTDYASLFFEERSGNIGGEFVVGSGATLDASIVDGSIKFKLSSALNDGSITVKDGGTFLVKELYSDASSTGANPSGQSKSVDGSNGAITSMPASVSASQVGTRGGNFFIDAGATYKVGSEYVVGGTAPMFTISDGGTLQVPMYWGLGIINSVLKRELYQTDFETGATDVVFTVNKNLNLLGRSLKVNDSTKLDATTTAKIGNGLLLGDATLILKEAKRAYMDGSKAAALAGTLVDTTAGNGKIASGSMSALDTGWAPEVNSPIVHISGTDGLVTVSGTTTNVSWEDGHLLKVKVDIPLSAITGATQFIRGEIRNGNPSEDYFNIWAFDSVAGNTHITLLDKASGVITPSARDKKIDYILIGKDADNQYQGTKIMTVDYSSLTLAN